MKHAPKNKMSENAKDEITNADHKPNCLSNSEKSPVGVWQKDIEKHDYYYDDSHGYEVYNPDEVDEETDEN